MPTDHVRRSKRAVIFGAGKMACGLLGELLFEAGFSTAFVARSQNIEAINRQNSYYVGIAGKTPRWKRVRNCAALSIADEDAVIEAVAAADLVFTAVGIDNIPAIAPVIAEGLWRRLSHSRQPLNVIASENLPGTGAYLRHQIVGAAAPRKALLLDEYVGFTAALTHRIMTGGNVKDGTLHFTIDAPGDLIIDRRGLLEAPPGIVRTQISDEFDALFLEKLSTTNLAQAVASYIGHREGCKLVHEAARHKKIAPVVKAAVAEAVAAFQAEFPNLTAQVAQNAKEAVTRIADPGLGDTVERICRGPMRKLGARERLIGPARLAVKHGLPHEHLVKAIAAALIYYDERDVQSKILHYIVADEGIDCLLTAICGLLPHEPLAQAIKIEWARQFRERPSSASQLSRPQVVQKIVYDVVTEMADEVGGTDVSRHVLEITDEFKDARITAFLPILVKNKIRGRLGHISAA